MVRYTWAMGSQKRRKASKKMTLKEAEKITGGLDLWGTSDPKKFYKNVQEELADLFYQDRIIYTWNNLGHYAKSMYDTAQDAMDVLVANTNRPFKEKDKQRFYLVKFIEDQMNIKNNKDKGPRTIVNENFKICCSLHGVDFTKVSPSKTQINKKLVQRKSFYEHEHDKICEQIIEKRRRVLEEKKSEYNRWIKEEFRFKAKEFKAICQKILKK